MNLKFASISMLFLVIMLTPAFAVEMEEVAHQAEKYNEESKEKKSFFGKIKLITKGFKLVNKAKNAEKESEEKKNYVEEEDEEDDLFVKHDQEVLNKRELLEYRDSKKVVSKTNVVNQTFNNNRNSTVSNPLVPITPQSCIFHVNSIANFLAEQGFEASYIQDNAVDPSLVSKIVQIIDNKCNIRYTKVINLTDALVVVNTGAGNKEYSLEEFRKAFTGIVIQTNATLEDINNKERNYLNQEKNKAQTIHDKARSQVILWGILIGVAVILVVVGIMLLICYGYQLISAARRAPEYVARYTSVEAEQGLLNEVNNDINRPRMTDENTLESVLRHLKEVKKQKGITLYGDPVNEFIKCYRSMGVEVVALTTLQLVLYVTAQNWVNVILCIVGLILVLTGIGLIIAGIIKTVENGIKWHMANVITRRNKYDSNELEGWLSNDTTVQNCTCSSSVID